MASHHCTTSENIPISASTGRAPSSIDWCMWKWLFCLICFHSPQEQKCESVSIVEVTNRWLYHHSWMSGMMYLWLHSFFCRRTVHHFGLRLSLPTRIWWNCCWKEEQTQILQGRYEMRFGPRILVEYYFKPWLMVLIHTIWVPKKKWSVAGEEYVYWHLFVPWERQHFIYGSLGQWNDFPSCIMIANYR